MQADAAAAVHALAGAVQAAPGALCAGAPAAMRGFVAAGKAPGWRSGCAAFARALAPTPVSRSSASACEAAVSERTYRRFWERFS